MVPYEGRGGGGGWLHICFWYGCTPWKPKESPKPGQVFSQITNQNPGQIIYVIKMRPKAGVMWWIVLILHNTGNVHDYNSGGVLNSLCISLEQICWFSIDYWDYLLLYLRLFLGSNQCVSNIVEIMVLPPSKHACYIVLSILWWETGRENGSRTTHVPTPGRFFYFEWKPNPMPGLGRLCKPITGGGGHPDPLTNTSPPPPSVPYSFVVSTKFIPCPCVLFIFIMDDYIGKTRLFLY